MASGLQFCCPACHRTYPWKASLSGKKLRCPNCGESFTVIEPLFEPPSSLQAVPLEDFTAIDVECVAPATAPQKPNPSVELYAGVVLLLAMLLPLQPAVVSMVGVVADDAILRAGVYLTSLTFAILLVVRFAQSEMGSPILFTIAVGVVSALNGGPLIVAAVELGTRIDPVTGRFVYPTGLPMLAWVAGVGACLYFCMCGNSRSQPTRRAYRR